MMPYGCYIGVFMLPVFRQCLTYKVKLFLICRSWSRSPYLSLISEQFPSPCEECIVSQASLPRHSHTMAASIDCRVLKTNDTINSLVPVRCSNNFKSIIFKLTIQNSTLGTHSKIILRWMPKNLTSERSTLVQVMAWCCQAPSHYLSRVDRGLWCFLVSLGPIS